ncbi:hypothetical protein HDU97_004446 [Phlyctochytrium planicorne]|nr:hypothetical protein HDU97_004446 [Phlyctochytrium planicorne]
MTAATTAPQPQPPQSLKDPSPSSDDLIADDPKETENLEMAEDTSKLSFVWGLLRKLVNVKDIASVRMSLPANLMEPMSNLEFWNYNDRPDLFASAIGSMSTPIYQPTTRKHPHSTTEYLTALPPSQTNSITDPEDPVERMLRVVRWFMSKDTKWKDNKLRKPYNPILGEVFRCHWIVDPSPVPTFTEDTKTPRTSTTAPIASTSAPLLTTLARTDADSASTRSQRSEKTLVNKGKDDRSGIRVNCVTEQILHHPPVSAFYYRCEDKGVVARGVDHVSAKFTGTSIKVGAGDHNAGVYVKLEQRGDEEYNMTYPWASINGWLSGRPYITVSETTVVTCPKTKLKCVLLYKDEPYFTAPKFAVEGKIFRYDPEADAQKTERERKESEKLNKIPEKDVLATIWGSWNGKIHARLGSSGANASTSSLRTSVSSLKRESEEATLLLDIQASVTAEKLVRPLEEQEPNESRKLWKDVTDAILAKDYNAATRLKRQIEDGQRALKGEREKGLKQGYEIRYFDFKVPVGTPEAKVEPGMAFERGKPYLKPGVDITQ